MTETQCIECQREYTTDVENDHSYCPSCGVINHHR